LEDIRAAKTYGIQFIRLSLDKFPSKRWDFLMGDAAHYRSLDPDDLVFLKSILDMFTQESMPVVITMLGLPGSRWKQSNGNRSDLRIWSGRISTASRLLLAGFSEGIASIFHCGRIQYFE
jgi:hypothetical protein